jgi:hypothetical protein
MASEARIGIRTDTKQAEQGITSVRGMFANLAKDAKSSILTGIGLGAGVTAWNLLGTAVSKVGDFLMDSVKAAAEEEVGIRRLSTAIRENVVGWNGNIEAIERVIDEREKLGFSDGEQRDSLARLTAVTKDHNKALDLQRIAMDFARLRGIDLASAGDIIGKVYAGNVGILTRYGIQLARGTSATEALAEIQRRAAGQAEAFADTAAGAAATLAIEFENLQEDIGAELLPVMVDLAEVARDDLVPAIRGIVDGAKALEPILGPLGEIFRTAFVPGAHAAQGMREELEHLAAVSEASGRTTSNNWIAMGQAMRETTEEAAEDAGDLAVAVDEMTGDIADDMDQLVRTLVAGQTDWQNALEDYNEAFQNDMLPAAELAAIQAELKNWLARRNQAIRDGDAERVAIASAAIAALKERENELLRQLPQIALQQGLAYTGGLASGLAGAPKAAGTAAKGVTAGLNIPGTWTIGNTVGTYWANGIASGMAKGVSAAQKAANAAKAAMALAKSPWYVHAKEIGTKVGEAWGTGLSGSLGKAVKGMPDLDGALPSGGRAGMAMAGAGAIHTHIYLDGREIAEVVDRQHYYRQGTRATLPRH